MNSEPENIQHVMAEPVPADLAAQLAAIETGLLEDRAAAFERLHEQLNAQLEDADQAGQE